MTTKTSLKKPAAAKASALVALRSKQVMSSGDERFAEVIALIEAKRRYQAMNVALGEAHR